MKTYGFVHLEFGSQHRQQSLDMLGQFRQELVKGGDVAHLVVVDNASSGGLQAWRSEGFQSALVTGGDNSNREFSGWDVGVAALLAQAPPPDIWVFSNDTVALHHGWGRRKIAHYAREQSKFRAHTGPWLFGEINDFPKSLITPLGPQLEWVSSYLFSLNESLRAGLETISPGNALLDSLVRDHFEPGLGLFNENIHSDYGSFMSDWLVQDEADVTGKVRYKWYKAAPLTAATFDELRMKARCCLSESMLSLRARRFGADIRSPYDARSAREHVRKSCQFVSDKIGEKLIMHRHRS